jgi:hypothetical protein
MANIELWHTCRKWAILPRCLQLTDTISIIPLPRSKKQLWHSLCHILSGSSNITLCTRWNNVKMGNEYEFYTHRWRQTVILTCTAFFILHNFLGLAGGRALLWVLYCLVLYIAHVAAASGSGLVSTWPVVLARHLFGGI